MWPAKYPKLEQAPWLRERLGRANVQRRQYLRYARNHHERIAHEPVEFAGTVAAVSRTQEKLELPGLRSKHVSSSRTTLAPTDASTLILDLLPPIQDTRVEQLDETLSQATSLVSSQRDQHEDGELDVVKLSDVSKNGEPFECPYCWSIVQTKRQKTWRKHVLHDIRAWVCTFEDCRSELFEDRHTWFQHGLDSHRRIWTCQSCPNAQFPSPDLMSDHLSHMHGQQSLEVASAIMDSSSRPIAEIAASACPMCNEWELQLRERADQMGIPSSNVLLVSVHDFEYHLSQHLEQLALFAIHPILEGLLESASEAADPSDVLNKFTLYEQEHWPGASASTVPEEQSSLEADDLDDVDHDSGKASASVVTSEPTSISSATHLEVEQHSSGTKSSAAHDGAIDYIDNTHQSLLIADLKDPSRYLEELASLKHLQPTELEPGESFYCRNEDNADVWLESHGYRPREASDHYVQLLLHQLRERKKLILAEQEDWRRIYDSQGRTQLARACHTGNLQLVKEWMEHDPEGAEVYDHAGNIPLHVAAINGYTEIVDFLITQRCGLNWINNAGHTALTEAIANGHVDAVNSLRRAGAQSALRSLNSRYAPDTMLQEPSKADESRTTLENVLAGSGHSNTACEEATGRSKRVSDAKPSWISRFKFHGRKKAQKS